MKCCIYGREIVEYPNNPWPVNTNADAGCCDVCNFNIVIPERLKLVASDGKSK